MTTRVTKDNTKAFVKALRELTKHQVLVGIPDKTAGRKPEAGEPSDINNAAIGYMMENGAPASNIPARPHLKVGIADAKDVLVGKYRTGAKAVLDGKLANFDVVHTTVGLAAQSAVRAKITAGPFEPLAASTLAARKRRGRTGDKPLIDTGQYRNAINFVIRDKG